jgi:hypothetical protein
MSFLLSGLVHGHLPAHATGAGRLVRVAINTESDRGRQIHRRGGFPPPPPGTHATLGVTPAARQIGAGVTAAHEMTLTRTLAPGVEEWSCTACGRRLLMRRPPDFAQIVLDRGDEAAAHVGGTGGMRVSVSGARPAPRGLPAADRAWLAEQGIDWEPDGPA